MIQEIVMHTEKSDIPDGYFYDTETPDFYVYRHKYTGREIHIAKVPLLYVNVKDYTNGVLDKIKAEINEWYWQADKQALAKDSCVVDAMVDLFIRTIDKYQQESEAKE